MSSRKRDAKGKAKQNIEKMASHLNQKKQGSSSKGPSNATEMDGVWVLSEFIFCLKTITLLRK